MFQLMLWHRIYRVSICFDSFEAKYACPTVSQIPKGFAKTASVIFVWKKAGGLSGNRRWFMKRCVRQKDVCGKGFV